MFNIGNVMTRLPTILLLLVMEAGCSDGESKMSGGDDSIAESIEYVSERPTLSIEIRTDTEDDAKRIADIVFSKPKKSDGPRVAEIFLAYSEGLTYLRSTNGQALVESKKTLVTQKQEDGRLRLVIYGAGNANAIEGGIIASVIFESNNNNPGILEILTSRPIFAPGSANDGLLVSDPVTVE